PAEIAGPATRPLLRIGANSTPDRRAGRPRGWRRALLAKPSSPMASSPRACGPIVADLAAGRRAIDASRHRRRRSHAHVEATMQKKAAGSATNTMMEIVDPAEARRIIRAGDYAGHTAGVAPKY